MPFARAAGLQPGSQGQDRDESHVSMPFARAEGLQLAAGVEVEPVALQRLNALRSGRGTATNIFNGWLSLGTCCLNALRSGRGTATFVFTLRVAAVFCLNALRSGRGTAPRGSRWSKPVRFRLNALRSGRGTAPLRKVSRVGGVLKSQCPSLGPRDCTETSCAGRGVVPVSMPFARAEGLHRIGGQWPATSCERLNALRSGRGTAPGRCDGCRA